MDIANLVLPVFAVILTGWLAGALGYVPRGLAQGLVQFVYNVAMPALVFVTIAREPWNTLLDWRFLLAFGGGTLICFTAVFLIARLAGHRPFGSSAVIGAVAAMTNTTFVALPILQALYGQRGVLPAAIATAFIGVVMFPLLVLMLEFDRHGSHEIGRAALLKQVALNPVILSTLGGLLWSLAALPLPGPVETYLDIFGQALTPCALFAIGLSLSLATLRLHLGLAALLSAVKLLLLPLLVYGLCLASGLEPFLTLTAVVCGAVPTANTAYILAGAYRVEETLASSTISMTTLLSIATLLGWLYLLG